MPAYKAQAVGCEHFVSTSMQKQRDSENEMRKFMHWLVYLLYTLHTVIIVGAHALVVAYNVVASKQNVITFVVASSGIMYPICAHSIVEPSGLVPRRPRQFLVSCSAAGS